jgi:hypothetical protein
VALFSDRIAAYPLLFGMIVGLAITLTIEILRALDHNDNEHHFQRHRFDPYVASLRMSRLAASIVLRNFCPPPPSYSIRMRMRITAAGEL